ncbi:YraN family protein [Oceanirhabdus sp. W0125-5]|uniref:YraN family protein n=1 Tax=Oceanirhabdus sp. W0125-5 TaxID=2999116 RepID=UPI0022F32814|nr:YraN family protein [Oceanirhabdus sp. W0125-5]WBW94816.1 YraN family protein [Oceanirhabdus sp. W0125-5]
MKSYKKTFGSINENIVGSYLESNDYIIIENNYKHKLGEIDIIAHDVKNNCICFIEIKSKFNDTFSIYPSVTKKQLYRIRRSASIYLNKYFPNKNGRIDLINIANDGIKYSIDHVKDIIW